MTKTETGLRKLREFERNIAQLPNKFRNLLKGRAGKLATKALSKLTREPGGPQYPLRWQSERQRRAFFATKGFGKGIPYRRTGALLKGWRVEVEKTKEGAQVVMINPSEVARFVQADWVQKFHLDTGWVQVEDVQRDFYREVEDEGAKIWVEVCEEVIH